MNIIVFMDELGESNTRPHEAGGGSRLDGAVSMLEESGHALRLVIAGLRRTAEAEALRQMVLAPVPAIGGAQVRAVIAAKGCGASISTSMRAIRPGRC